jgi:hypothetical protein
MSSSPKWTAAELSENLRERQRSRARAKAAAERAAAEARDRAEQVKRLAQAKQTAGAAAKRAEERSTQAVRGAWEPFIDQRALADLRRRLAEAERAAAEATEEEGVRRAHREIDRVVDELPRLTSVAQEALLATRRHQAGERVRLVREECASVDPALSGKFDPAAAGEIRGLLDDAERRAGAGQVDEVAALLTRTRERLAVHRRAVAERHEQWATQRGHCDDALRRAEMAADNLRHHESVSRFKPNAAGAIEARLAALRPMLEADQFEDVERGVAAAQASIEAATAEAETWEAERQRQQTITDVLVDALVGESFRITAVLPSKSNDPRSPLVISASWPSGEKITVDVPASGPVRYGMAALMDLPAPSGTGELAAGCDVVTGIIGRVREFAAARDVRLGATYFDGMPEELPDERESLPLPIQEYRTRSEG